MNQQEQSPESQPQSDQAEQAEAVKKSDNTEAMVAMDKCVFDVDGDMICCKPPWFDSMAEDEVGFGHDERDAYDDFIFNYYGQATEEELEEEARDQAGEDARSQVLVDVGVALTDTLYKEMEAQIIKHDEDLHYFDMVDVMVAVMEANFKKILVQLAGMHYGELFLLIQYRQYQKCMRMLKNLSRLEYKDHKDSMSEEDRVLVKEMAIQQRKENFAAGVGCKTQACAYPTKGGAEYCASCIVVAVESGKKRG